MPTKKLKTTRKIKNKIINRVAIVLDASGSMYGLRSVAVDSVNENIKRIQKESQASGQETYISLVLFGSTIRELYWNVPANAVKLFTLSDYPDLGGTALIEAVGKTAEKYIEGGGDEAFLIITITDGYENQSSQHYKSRIAAIIKDRQVKGNWSFVFNVPNQYGKNTLMGYGVLDDNIRVWEQTTQGVKAMAQATDVGLTSYFGARGMGAKSVQNFYNVQADLSQLDTKDIKKKCRDYKAQFKVLPVTKECPIKEFVEDNFGPYNAGCAFYELTKPEKISSSKSVYIQEKGKTAIFGGTEARELIGLPDNADAKVDPYNLSRFKVFVQSTSLNRKLVRGTSVLVRK